MADENEKAAYAKTLKMSAEMRRYTFNTSTGLRELTSFASARADVRGYTAEELISNVQQGDARAIIYAPDLTDNGWPGDVTADDILFFDGKEYQVIAPGTRRGRTGTIVAWDLQIRG